MPIYQTLLYTQHLNSFKNQNPTQTLSPYPHWHHHHRLVMAQNPGIIHDPQYNNFFNGTYERYMTGPKPLGFKFLPTDLQLIKIYLRHKLIYRSFPRGFHKLFLDVNLYNHNPEELVSMHRDTEIEQESWYFFTSRERKYRNGFRPQRSAGDGYWRATAKDSPIFDDDGNIIGYKKVLDFYVGKHPEGNRTEWKMHEYLTKDQKDHAHLPSTSQSPNPMQLNDWVLCKIYKNQREKKRNDHLEEDDCENVDVNILQKNNDNDDQQRQNVDSVPNVNLMQRNNDQPQNVDQNPPDHSIMDDPDDLLPTLLADDPPIQSLESLFGW